MGSFIKFGLTQSKMGKFLRCGFGYDQHYNKKCRPTRGSTALVFGIAMDDMLNALLMGETDDKELMVIFKKAMSKTPLGTVNVGKKDYDKHIISKERRVIAQAFLLKRFKAKKDMDVLFEELFEKQSKDLKMTVNEQKILDYAARVSLISKSEILLAAYKEQIMPRVKKVHAVQKASEVGILDFKADIDKVGNTYVVDNKTAGKVYEEKAADYSVQLILYAIEEKCNQIMFIVLPKNIQRNTTKTCKDCSHVATSSHKTCNNEIEGKRCNGEWDVVMDFYIEIQVVEAKVTKTMIKRAKEIKAGIQDMIDQKKFVCNFANCDNQFGRPCDYRELYWKGSMKGLEVKK